MTQTVTAERLCRTHSSQLHTEHVNQVSGLVEQKDGNLT